MISARDSVLRWFVAFTFRFKRSDSVSESPNVNQSIVSISSTEGSEPGSPPTSGGAIQFSPARNKEYLHDASDVIRKVLFSTRSNIRLLHEVLRQVRLHCKKLCLYSKLVSVAWILNRLTTINCPFSCPSTCNQKIHLFVSPLLACFEWNGYVMMDWSLSNNW